MKGITSIYKGGGETHLSILVGWKTIASGIMGAIGNYLQTLGDPVLQLIGTIMISLALILFPVGVTHKIMKAVKVIKE
jgi:hypothetical protein